MEDYVVPVFVEAKLEYTNQLVNTLKPYIYEGFKSIYEESCEICVKKQIKQQRLKTYQTLLCQIPQWNQEIIETEFERIITASGCDWFDDLVTAVFLAHTKILTSIGQKRNVESVNLKIPRSSNFVHKIYINIAREIWKNPYLFDHEISANNYQRNIRDIESIISEGIKDSVRRLLPVKDILKDYLTITEDDIDNKKKKDDDDEDNDEDKDNDDKDDDDKDDETDINLDKNTDETKEDTDAFNSNENNENIDDIKEIPSVPPPLSPDENLEATDPSTMEATSEGLPGAIANAPSEGEVDNSVDTTGAIATVDTTIGGEEHSELTNGDPIFQQSTDDTARPDSDSFPGDPTEKNISLNEAKPLSMTFDDGDSMDNFIQDAAKLVEKNNPEEQGNIQKYLEDKTQQEAGGEKIFTLFDDAAEIDEL
jgi:hypothetical protein